MKKIAIHTQRFHPSIGGMEIHISGLVKNCRNFDFEVLTNAVPGYPRLEKIDDRITIRRFGPDDRNFVPYKNRTIHKMTFPLRHSSDKARQNNIQKFLDIGNYDIFHAHHPSIPHTFAKKSKVTGRPIPISNTIFKTSKPKLLTIHGLLHTMNPDKAFKEYEDKLINSYNNIICVDKKIYDFAISQTKSENNIWHIPNSIDTALFAPRPFVESDKLKIGFVGRLEKSRGIGLLENLINNLPAYAELHMVGAANTTIIKDFKKRNPCAKLHFHSNVPNEKLPEFFGGIDILFNPVLAEGISRISLESMACGRPVIMLAKGDRHPVIDGETGLLVKSDISEIIGALENVHSNGDMLLNLSSEARKVVEKEFSNEVIIPKIESIYQMLLKGKNGM